MAMRLSGLMSGMDTESIISQLVEARRTKVDTQKKAQTKLGWQQDAWKELNTKLKNLQSKYVGIMRFSSAYTKKVTKVSNSSAVSVITGENAVNGVQSLRINKLAKTGYMTGGAIGSDSEYVATDKIAKVMKLGDGEGLDGTINIKTGGKSIDIKVTENTTISDFLTQVKNAGLNASFDSKWQRFSISAKESGLANDFSITASNGDGDKVLVALGLQVADLKSDEATYREYQTFAALYDPTSEANTISNLDSYISKTISDRKESYLAQYKTATAGLKEAEDKIKEIQDKYEGGLDLSVDYGTALNAKKDEIKALKEKMKDLKGDDLKQAQKELDKLNDEATDLSNRKADAKVLDNQQKSVDKYSAQLESIAEYVTIKEDETGDGTYDVQLATYEDVDGKEHKKLEDEVTASYYAKAAYAKQVIDAYDPDAEVVNDGKGATKVSGQDAEIYLNDALYTNSTNVFEINGLTFTALSETAPGETVTVTTEQDTDGIYDMIKNFLKEYNSIINEMDKLYNADSAKGYEPLTDEEKDAMSDREIEEWESKVKDSLLRRDSNLSSVSSALKKIMSEGVEVNGKKMYLFNFGIDTLGYFNAADNEKNAYHIDGDPDDADTAGNADKLKSMIASDPDTVISFFSQLSQNMYQKMFDMSKSVNGYRSFGNFYDDKKMKSDYDSYNSKIAELEKKLQDYEDMWYAKFSKMETAMAKMQSNASAVTSLLGG